MTDPLLSLLGMARRAGKLVPGFDAVLQSIRAGKSHAVFIASDISEKTAENICFAAEKAKVPARRFDCPMAELSAAIGIKTGIVALEDRGFAKSALRRCEQHNTEDTKEEMSL